MADCETFGMCKHEREVLLSLVFDELLSAVGI